MKKKRNPKWNLSDVFCGALAFLSVYVLALLSKVAAPHPIKLRLDIIVVVLLLTLNTALVVLFYQNRRLKERLKEADENKEK